jgi:oligoendopeptidase F
MRNDITFSTEEAIDIVATALGKFDPQMEKVIREAAKQGRISFAPSYGAHANHSGLVEAAPNDIKKLPHEYRRLPYASVPLETDDRRVGLEDLFILAHECAHLYAYQAHETYSRNSSAKEFLPLMDMLLHETVALLGERFLYRHLKERCAGDLDKEYEIEKTWADFLDFRLLYSGKMVRLQEELAYKYK